MAATTTDEVRAAAVGLLTVLARATAVREEAFAAASRLRTVGDACDLPRLSHAVMNEAAGIAHDVEEDEAPLDHQVDEVRAFLELLDIASVATAEPIAVTA